MVQPEGNLMTYTSQVGSLNCSGVNAKLQMQKPIQLHMYFVFQELLALNIQDAVTP